MIQEMHERLKRSNEHRNCGADEEIVSLRAALAAKDDRIEQLTADYDRLIPILAAKDVEIERLKAQQKPETCVWRVEDGKRAVTSCYSAVYTWSQIATGPEICPDCGKRVEVQGMMEASK